jgi:lipoyl(octanoyl) transferase
VRIERLGRREYREVSALQEEARRQLLDGSGDEVLFLVEHPAVVTLGRSASLTNLRVDASELERRGVALERSSRGGDITYHGPGQLVAYPVVRISAGRHGVRGHVRALAQAVVEVARAFGLAAQYREECVGVWVGERKLAAIGVHVHRRVAVHGVALNVSTDLEPFSQLIVPCGLAKPVTSLEAELGREVPMATVERALTVELRRRFARTTRRPEELACASSSP